MLGPGTNIEQFVEENPKPDLEVGDVVHYETLTNNKP